MADFVDCLSDAQLRSKLAEYGFPVIPITPSTRKVVAKKLKMLIISGGRRPLTAVTTNKATRTGTRKDETFHGRIAASTVNTNRAATSSFNFGLPGSSQLNLFEFGANDPSVEHLNQTCSRLNISPYTMPGGYPTSGGVPQHRAATTSSSFNFGLPGSPQLGSWLNAQEFSVNYPSVEPLNQTYSRLHIDPYSMPGGYPTSGEVLQQNIPKVDKATPLNHQEKIQPNSCTVCLGTPATHACVPCGHQCLCQQCAERIMETKFCPLCRQRIDTIIRIFVN